MSDYYVWRERETERKMGHRLRKSACIEAKRLAKENRGETFHILEIRGLYKCDVKPTFGSLDVGQLFRHGDRTLIKMEPMVQVTDGEICTYNALRLAPAKVAGQHSQFVDKTEVYIEDVRL